MMRYGAIAVASIGGWLAFCGAAVANVQDSPAEAENPYQAIIDRNVFRLKPIPPPPAPEEVKPPTPKITLTGITTIFGNKRAVLETPPPPTKPGEPTKYKQYFMLTEGQRDGDMEVLEINASAGTVKVSYAGTVAVLDWEKNGAKVVNTGPAPGMMPMPSPPGGVPMPGTPGQITPVTRSLRLPTPGGAVGQPGGYQPNSVPTGYTPQNQPMSSYQGNVLTQPGNVQIQPSYSYPGQTAAIPQQSTQQPQMTAEQQFLMVEAHRELTKNQVSAGLMPPLPPTPYTPPGSPGSVTPSPQGDGNFPIQQQQPMLPRRPGMPALPQ